MQNADTTQFFLGGSSIVYFYYYNIPRNSIQSKQQSKQFYAQFPVSSRYFFCRIFMSSRFPTAVRARFFGREKRSEAGSIAITLLLLFPPAASNCYSQERIEAVDQDSRVNFLKQPLATSKKQPRMSELSHSTTSAAAIKQRIHSSSVCCAVDVVQFVLMSFF